MKAGEPEIVVGVGPRARPFAKILEGSHRGLPLQALLEATKPRLLSLVLWAVSVGFYLASPRPLDFGLLLKTFAGVTLVAAGAMALNQWMERENDAKMKRTEHRPLADERLRPQDVLFFGIFLSLAGLGVLLAGVNLLTAFLSGLTLAGYLLIYTPLKTRTPLCTLVGAVPGAIPPLLGWAAREGSLSGGAWLLFAVIFVWQLPHFLAISWAWREDYARAGFQMRAVLDPTGERVGREMILWTALLLPVSLAPAFAGMTGPLYFWVTLVLGVWFLRAAFRTASDLNGRALSFFRASLIYLTVLLCLTVLDKKPF